MIPAIWPTCGRPPATPSATTNYSSEALASRSRLLAPPAFRLKAIPKSPLEIDYEITIPADAPRDSTHGEFVTLALEADMADIAPVDPTPAPGS